jgi:two-component system, NtrC family, response regulator AtoC
MNYHWPGNVRELKNGVERVIVLTKGSHITVDDLPIPPSPKTTPNDQSLEAVERAHIKDILEQTGGNITRSAQILGIDRATLYITKSKNMVCENKSDFIYTATPFRR